MPVALNVFDWPSVEVSKLLFHAGGMARQGGFTSGSVLIVHPEPGGRSWLEMEFGYQPNDEADNLISWLCSKIANGTVFRVPLVWTPQVCPPARLSLTPDGIEIVNGIPWDNDQPWDSGSGWRYEPLVTAVSASLESSLVLVVDMGTFLPGLSYGHVIGHRDACYKIDDIAYSGSTATITVMTPLRRDVVVGDLISLRPTGTFAATNPESFRGLYEAADLVALGPVRFAEVIL